MSPQINFYKAKEFFASLTTREQWFFIALFLANYDDRKVTTTEVFKLLNANVFKKNLFFMLVQQFEASGEKGRELVAKFIKINRPQKPDSVGMVRVILADGRVMCNFVNQFDWGNVIYWEWWQRDGISN
jgi:hypothetical protein